MVPNGGMEFGFRAGADVTYQMADKNWEETNATSPTAPVAYSTEAYFKYGMNDRSDLEISLPWYFYDKDYALLHDRTESFGGFDRAHLAAKIGLGKTGTGLVAGFFVPVGQEKIVGFKPEWGFTLGTFCGYRKGTWYADGLATWSTTPKSSSGFQPGDVTVMMARGGVQLDEGVAPNFALNYSFTGRSNTNDVASGEVVHKILATPGCLLQLDEDWTMDVRVPVVVMGANVHASAGLSVGIIGYFEP